MVRLEVQTCRSLFFLSFRAARPTSACSLPSFTVGGGNEIKPKHELNWAPGGGGTNHCCENQQVTLSPSRGVVVAWRNEREKYDPIVEKLGEDARR